MAKIRLWKVTLSDKLFPDKKVVLGTFPSETKAGAEKKARARHDAMLKKMDLNSWTISTELLNADPEAA